MQNGLGIPSRVISAADLTTMQPFARVDDITAASFEPDSGYVDAVAATRSMVRAAERAGATVLEHCPVLAIESDGERVRGVRTPAGIIATNTVVCAAGPWSPKLLRPIGVPAPIETLRVQIAIVQRPLVLEADPFIYLDMVVGMFTRPWGPGRSLVGVGGGDQHDPVDPDCYEPRNDSAYPATAIAAASRRIPAMAGAIYLHGHAGLFDMTPDTHPILGAVGNQGPDGLYLAIGFSGAGFKKGPAIGQVLAELIVDGRPSLVDLHPFRLARFADDAWQAPWSETEYVFSTDFGHRL
jgi:sarcosine oxidase subunit beta